MSLVSCVNSKGEVVIASNCLEMVVNAIEKGYDTAFYNKEGHKLDFGAAWHTLGGYPKTEPIFDGGSDCTWWYDSNDSPLYQMTFVDEDGNAIY